MVRRRPKTADIGHLRTMSPAVVLCTALISGVALVLMTVEDISSLEERDLAVPFGSHRLSLLQLDAARTHQALVTSNGLSGAIMSLQGADGASRARLSSLAHVGW